MRRTIVLDTSPLSLLADPRAAPRPQEIRRWANQHLHRGHELVVPAIADYEVRRELIRLKNTRSLALLDQFGGDRYLPLTDEALKLAAALWAQARSRGAPTADPRDLDCDVLIAAQALTLDLPGADIVIATSNVGHLAQFVAAAPWGDIVP